MSGRRDANKTPATMIAIAIHSAPDGMSPRMGMARSDATAGTSAMIAVAAADPSSETARLNVKIATPLVTAPLIPQFTRLHGPLRWSGAPNSTGAIHPAC